MELFLLEDTPSKRKYACVMAHLPNEVRPGISAIQSRLDPDDVIDAPTSKADENPHITVLYGLHNSDPTNVFNRLRRSMVHLGDEPQAELQGLSLFQNQDQDVLKIGVDSPDLHRLNTIAREEPHTLSFPDYHPHVTIATLKAGTGAKYLDLPNPLHGRQVQIRHLVHSNPEKEYAWFPIRPPSMGEALEMRAYWGFQADQILELVTATAIGTRPMGMGFVRPIYPNTMARKRVKNKF